MWVSAEGASNGMPEDILVVCCWVDLGINPKLVLGADLVDIDSPGSA